MYSKSDVSSDSEIVIGESAIFRHILYQVGIIAKSDSVTLIQGETGTGKEVIAHAIHSQSLRSQGPFVKLNCAAIPAALLESELFGHERGAFTGAVAQTMGRFQRADHGTLFLDEIGDLPLELQPKLLRALQEREFERLGGTQTIRVNVRVVAATNQDLAQLVATKQFRPDLYYRLNVIPVTLPPLRDRVQDIPLLVRHFAEKFSARLQRPMLTIPPEVMDALQAYDWPGNIRELQNFIERSVVLSAGPVLRPSLAELCHLTKQRTDSVAQTFADASRDHILEVLEQAQWMIGGRHGAAERLGLPRTTLIYKMRKLGIEPRRSQHARSAHRLGLGSGSEPLEAAAHC
ncbi:sigma-54 interaction domain-containing protein [Paludibaculum fermentans]|uniref:sigma-54 interaction domain-containing protein n=1 Tax=Paludibaculum fermentans TaxID=1473598 RepID=UPI003EB9682E